jgi:hypothetical protein
MAFVSPLLPLKLNKRGNNMIAMDESAIKLIDKFAAMPQAR